MDEQQQQQPPPLKADQVVIGKPAEQFGMRHLKFHCPKCFVPWALSTAGHFICHCGSVLEVREPEKAS